ncbi:hypothetical protein PAXRUDRAFT_137682 [Paxillus rubicundulus Ve08.2h10]|uniref:Unplaced genomic scaffold scaffold_146, whole genome shotgun sequence n=1 Tax=Paxillus rubicundulus Ve08.2h10 TaxID=930991 RepID=A0A0D0E0E4_9AGAM|nr:hypothetical protein PAXRUDRAFT_137682 [Paxillus rubicundulus Ve08.2h10]
MLASVSPLALILPRPQIPSLIPRFSTPSSAPRTPNRSPAASHILLSPPAANRNSTDSWNSSNYDFEDPNAEWKEEDVNFLSRTLDALPAHLITPFNGFVPPSNLLDRIARGVSAAKGPNEWHHSIRATRIKLLQLARLRAQEDRRRVVIREHTPVLNEDQPSSARNPEINRQRTPDPAEVLQPRINTPNHIRRPLYRQSSMDFMCSVQPDQSETIARLSTRLQRHERVLHHPYIRPTHVRQRSEHNIIAPSTPSLSTLNSNRHSDIRKSTVSATSASTSSFGSPMSISAPLRPSSLRRASTITLASTNEMQGGPDAENVFKSAESRRSGGYAEAGMVTKVGVKVKHAPSYNGSKCLVPPPVTPSSEPKKLKLTPATASRRKATTHKPSAGEIQMTPQTPPTEPRALVPEKVTPIHTSAQARKVRKGHTPQLSVSSDEEEKTRSKSSKKARTRGPSSSALLPSPTRTQPSLLLASALSKQQEGSDSKRSMSTRRRSKMSISTSTSTSRSDNDLSTASTDTAATTVSASSISVSQPKHTRARNPNLRIDTQPLTQSPAVTKEPAHRNLARNPSMFGPELPCPQHTPVSPSRIPVLSPVSVLLSPVSLGPTPTPTTSLVPLRPRTLRRTARRISFGSVVVDGNLAESSHLPDGQTLTLGSAFQLA